MKGKRSTTRDRSRHKDNSTKLRTEDGDREKAELIPIGAKNVIISSAEEREGGKKLGVGSKGLKFRNQFQETREREWLLKRQRGR